jgi:ABC-2 type transport system ATP-binding protein
MWDVINERVRSGATLLLTTQYLEEADRLADEVVVIDHGRALAKGTPSDLKRQVGGERLEVTVADAAETESVRAIVEKVCQEPPSVDREAHRVSAPVTGGAGTLVEVVRQLDAAGVEPLDIGIHRATLDDVFLKLTGQAATVEPAEETAGAGRRGRSGRRGTGGAS